MPDLMNHKLESRVAGRNINNLRYMDNTTLMAESEEELKRFLMGIKEESEKALNVGLKFNIKNEDHGIQSHHVIANKRKKVEAVTDFLS